MRADQQPPDYSPDHWQKFCLYVQNCKKDDHEQVDETAAISLLFFTGGQDAIHLLQENGLNHNEIVNFNVILSKLEELFLMKVIHFYEVFRQMLRDKPKNQFQNEFSLPVEINDEECIVAENLNVTSYCPKAFPEESENLLNGTILNNDVIQEVESGGEYRKENGTIENSYLKLKANEEHVKKRKQKNEKIIKSSLIGTSSGKRKDFSSKRLKKTKNVTNRDEISIGNLNTRRSSRQIRVSSRYAENREEIQNLLKPDMVKIQNLEQIPAEPSCICSTCEKMFPDPNTLVTHWKSHKNNLRKKKGLPFMCKVCQKCFVTFSQLKVHYKGHKKTNSEKERLEKKKIPSSKSKDLKCRHCGKTFSKKESLSNHLKRHLGSMRVTSKTKFHSDNLKKKKVVATSKLFQCKICRKSFKHEKNLQMHTTVHTGEKPYECHVCGKRFRLKTSLTLHSRLHDTTSHLKCDICPKTCVDQKALEKHKLIHSDIKPYSCQVCGKTFRYLAGFRNHQRLHKVDEAFKCELCEKRFVDKWGLARHRTIHTGEKPFICSECGKMFRLKRGLVSHMKLHDKDSHLKCDLCPRTFVEQRKLDLHLKAHSGDKPIICDKCGKQFLYPINLKVHKRLHTGEKPYHCSYCEKSFNQQGTLIAHERQHTGDRPYVCDICGNRFITKSQLTIHTRKHNDDRPYKCDQCDYAAYTASILKIHKIKHSTGRPFKCVTCSAAFKRQQHLEVHNRIHQDDNKSKKVVKKHNCAYCEESFNSEASLSSHLSTHEIVIVSTKTAASDIFIDQEQGPEEVAYNIVVL